MSRSARRAMVRRSDPALSLSRQCSILSISRSSLYYRSKGESAESLALMRRIDELYLKYPFYGSRQMARQLGREGHLVGPAPGAAADAADGLASDPSAAPDQRGASRASDLSLSSAGYDDRSAEPGLVRRHHLHPGPSRLHVSGGYHGLGDAPCPGLAAVEHAGRRLLHRRARRGVGQVRQAGDLQHRSGQPVHRRRLHRAITGGGGEDLDGRQGGAGSTTSSSSVSGAR